MHLHCVEDPMADVLQELPGQRRRRSLSQSERTGPPPPPPPPPPPSVDVGGLVETVLARAAELYGRLLRLAFPVPFTPSSHVYVWPDRSDNYQPMMAEISTDETGAWRGCVDAGRKHRGVDDDEATAVTEYSSSSEDGEDDEEEDPAEDALETRAARVLSVASYGPEETVLAVDRYLCPCGKCAQYEAIARDVARVVTWRDAAARASVTRILQAFSTYNEAIGYRADMIETADECLSTWCGDEHQAFTSFVVLQDVVPFLCANAV